MRNAFVTAGTALIFGGLAFTGPAQAVSPLPHYEATPLVIPAGAKRSGTICVLT